MNITEKDKLADEPEIEFTWVKISSKDELQNFYNGLIPKIREAARELGYAIGIHGSMRRDLDLIAVPWTDEAADKDALAISIHKAACGPQGEIYSGEKKPGGRTATCFPICFPNHKTMAVESSLGHIDLSVMTVNAELAADNAENKKEIAELKRRLGAGEGALRWYSCNFSDYAYQADTALAEITKGLPLKETEENENARKQKEKTNENYIEEVVGHFSSNRNDPVSPLNP